MQESPSSGGVWFNDLAIGAGCRGDLGLGKPFDTRWMPACCSRDGIAVRRLTDAPSSHFGTGHDMHDKQKGPLSRP